jgi:hypothetical protein
MIKLEGKSSQLELHGIRVGNIGIHGCGWQKLLVGFRFDIRATKLNPIYVAMISGKLLLPVEAFGH